ncbi:MAG: PD-(D/E)XK nuclease family protein [Lachnospiraceae bacterium]|nr:PD-(D/E)XK nuclease family protein [Lachnospiraceae bacterium]
MSLRFYIGSSGAGKSSRLQEDIIERSMKEPERHFFILVPDQYTMQTQKEMIERHPLHGFMNIEIFSFGRLAHYIFEEVGQPERLTLDDTGKNLILRKLASEMAEELPVIGRYLKKTGYVHEVKSVISEFMQYGLDVSQVDKLCTAVKDKPVLKGKLQDINRLYESFLKYLGDKYITTEETMDLLAERLDKSELIKGSIVALDGFTGFTPVQNHVIGRLLTLCEEVILTVTLPAEDIEQLKQTGPEESSLFALSKKTILTMNRLAKEMDVPRGEDILLKGAPVIRYRTQPALAHLEQHLFRAGTGIYREQAGGIHIYSAISPREELRKTFIRIRRLIQEKKYAYRDIAIVTGDLERYASYAAEMSERYDVPIFLDNNRKLGLNPFTEYVKSGLRVIRNNFSYESVVHFLKCGFTGLSEEEIDRLENYMLALKIRGEKTWSRAFVRYPAYMRQHTQEPQQTQDPLQQINQTREALMELLGPLLPLKKGGPAEEMVKILYHFIADHNIYDKLQEYVGYFKDQEDFSRAGEYDQIYGYLMQLLEQMAALLEGEELSLEEFIEILEAGILELQVGILPQDTDRVVIGDIERTRLKQVKALFFVGVNEGIIPKHNTGGGMISDMDREMIADAGYELSPTPRQKMYTQRLYLYMNMTKPSEQLWLSYAQVDAEGKSLRPSYLVGMLHKMFPKLEEDGRESVDGMLPVMDEIVALKDSREYFAHLFREYAGQTLQREMRPMFAALYKEYEKRDATTLSIIRDAAFYHYTPETLNREVVRALYGAVLENSISRMEAYARCAYAHFLQYGMQLKEREDYSFGNMDMGNFFHQALEQFGLQLKEQGLSWIDFTKEQAEEILDYILNNIAVAYGESVIYQDERTAYRLTQIRRILLRTVQNLQYQLKKGSFVPQELEYSFRKEVSVDRVKLGLTEDEKLMLTGKIDRYDVFEKDDALYVKVIDYKSKDKKIDLVQLYYGLQLQLAVYLEQAVERVKKRNPGKQVIPAALFYYPVTDPIMAQENANISQEEWERWMHEKLRVSGYFVEDEDVIQGLDRTYIDVSDVIRLEKKKDGSYTAASQVIPRDTLNLLSDYADHMIRKIGSEILQGDRNARPCGDTACSYCTYREVCCFDKRLPGFESLDMDMSETEAMEKIAEELTDS